jgi:hypothetical protein
MKKILLILTVMLLSGCGDDSIQNPSRYSGCVVTDKQYFFSTHKVQVKLTPAYKYKRKNSDYLWFNTVKWEYDKLNIGDTIK